MFSRLSTWLISLRSPRPVDLSTAESVDLSKLRAHLKLLKVRVDYHTTNRDSAHAAGRLTDYNLHESLREAFDSELHLLADVLKIK